MHSLNNMSCCSCSCSCSCLALMLWWPLRVAINSFLVESLQARKSTFFPVRTTKLVGLCIFVPAHVLGWLVRHRVHCLNSAMPGPWASWCWLCGRGVKKEGGGEGVKVISSYHRNLLLTLRAKHLPSIQPTSFVSPCARHCHVFLKPCSLLVAESSVTGIKSFLHSGCCPPGAVADMRGNCRCTLEARADSECQWFCRKLR